MASGDTLVMWTATTNEPPAAGFATLDFRNGQPVLDFDPGSTETAVFSGVSYRGIIAGGGITATITWMASTATSV